jgi:hypothetical protein
MAIITKQTILDGSKNLVVKIHIEGDVGGDETDTVLIDASSYSPIFDGGRVMGIHSALVGFTAHLDWDATTNIPLLDIPDYEYNLNGEQIGWFGGIPNNAGAGKTGDILISTTGLGAGDHGMIILELAKS